MHLEQTIPELAANSPVIIWGSLIVGALGVLSMIVPAITKNVDGLGGLIAAARRTQNESKAAEIAGLSGRIDILADQVRALTEELHARNEAAEAHTEWDNDTKTRAARNGLALAPMPSLYVLDCPKAAEAAAKAQPRPTLVETPNPEENTP